MNKGSESPTNDNKVRRVMLVNFWLHLEVAEREREILGLLFLGEVDDSFSSWLSQDESILYLLIPLPLHVDYVSKTDFFLTKVKLVQPA